MTTNSLIFKTRLQPNIEQSRQLRQAIGSARFAHNCVLAHVFQNFENQRSKPEADREYQSCSPFDLRKLWVHELRSEYAPWANEVSGDAFEFGISTAAAGLKNWFKKRTNAPKYHKRSTSDSVMFGTNSRLRNKGSAVHLSKIGEIKLIERMKAADWLIRCGAKLTGVFIHQQAGQWIVSLRVKTPDKLYEQYLSGRHYEKRDAAVGLDVGLEKFITTSDGQFSANPRFFRNEAAKLKKAQQRVARRKAESRRRTKAQLQVQKIHQKITNRRENFQHQLSREIVDRYSFIAIENLNIKGMLKNRRLAKSISDASWASFFTKLGYKLERAGGSLVKIDRFYPSSKTCSNCDQVKAKLDLGERIYNCAFCGFEIDRDLNAAVNIVRKGSVGYAERIGQSRANTLTSSKPSKEGSLLEELLTGASQNASQGC